MRRLWSGLVWVVGLEVQMYVGLLRLVTGRTDVPAGATAHRYVGAVAALLWGITGVSAVELVVLHVIIPWETVRLAADVLGIWGLVWCAGLTGCHYVYPHLSDEAGLRIRATHRRPTIVCAWSHVRRIVVRERSREGSRMVQIDPGEGPDGGALMLVVVGARTNVEIELVRPVRATVRGSTYEVTAVRFFADNPTAVRDIARLR